MSIIRNITDIYFTSDNVDNIIEINILKNSLIHSLFISNYLINKINQSKSSNNIYDIFTLSFENSGLNIVNLGNSNYNIEKILVQKSLKFKKKYSVGFNIIGYYIRNLANNLLSWSTLKDYNSDNYNYIDKNTDFKGTFTIKNDLKKIRVNVRFSTQTENTNVNIKNLINISTENKLLGYKNEIENTFLIAPLLKPSPSIIFDTKLINNDVLSTNDLIEFDNNTSFTIPALNFEDDIRTYNINMRPLRFTNITENIKESETIMFKFSSTGLNNEVYNQEYDIINSKYRLNLNIITIKFRNNFSSDQIDNRILINKYTNKNIETERYENNEIKKNNINISGWTRNYFLTQKLHGITYNRIKSVFNYTDIKYNLIVINTDNNIIELYFQNNSLNAEKGIYNILDKIENVDYNNDALNLYPKSKEGQDGKKCSIKFILNNSNFDILNNVIIDDSVVSIAGIKVSNNKLLVNLNMILDDGAPSRRDNLRATYSNKIYYQPKEENFFYKLKMEQQLITDSNFIIDFLRTIGRGSYLSGDLQGKEFFKNPLLSTNTLIETFRYKTFITDSNNNVNIKFERLNLSDKTIQDLSKNNVSLLSKYTPTFRINEGNILHFDTSDSSNKSLTIRFYHDISCNNEIFTSYGYTLAEYSRNYENGENGGYISIKVPSAEIYGITIYYKVVNLNNYVTKVMNNGEPGKIIIDNTKEIELADIIVNDIYNTNSTNYNVNNGLITYDNDPNHFYKIIQEDNTADMSFNEITYNHNFLNNIEFKNITNEGNIEISSKNVYNFGVDNIVIIKNSFNVWDNTMYFNNNDLKHGIMRVGIIDANKVYQDTVGTKNYLLVNGDNDDKIVKKYPYTYKNNIERIYYNGTTLNNNTKNKSNYIIYFTSHHTGQNIPQKAHNIAKVSDYLDDNVDFSGNNWYYSGAGKDLSNNLYLVNYNTKSCLVEIVEDSVGNIIKCSKVKESDRILSSSPTTSDGLVSAYRTATSTVSATAGWVGLNSTYINYDDNVIANINIAFARKKLPLETTLKINNNVDNNSELFLFEPLDYSGNINRGINGNYYTNHYNERPFLVGFFDNVASSTIRLFQVKINTDITSIKIKNYYSLINNTDIVDINNGKPYYKRVVDSWYSYNINEFGLFETVPHEIIDLYLKKSSDNFIIPRSSNTYDFGVFDFLSLDIREYCDYTLEIEHYKNWYSYSETDSPYIQYTLYKKDISSYLSYIDICSNKIKGNVDNINSDYNLVRNFPQRTFKIDSSGNLLYFPTNDSIFKLDHKKTTSNPIPNKYYILFQFQNNITNDFLNDMPSNKFFNYNISEDNTKRPFGGIADQIVEVNGKTILNINTLNTIGKSESAITDNSFNEFLIDQDPSLNLVINRQSNLNLENIQFKITVPDNSIRTKIGQGEITSFVEEYSFGADSPDPSGAFTGISAETITVNVVNITKIFNLKIHVQYGRHVYLSWDFSNDNTTVLIMYEIWRKQGTSDYSLIATTTTKNYLDTTPMRFIVAYYKVRCLLTWETESLGTEFVEQQILVCENNNFQFGRYNNTTENTKLYKPINNSNYCRKKSKKKTGNLFPNSTNYSKKQVYTILSNNSKRPFR